MRRPNLKEMGIGALAALGLWGGSEISKDDAEIAHGTTNKPTHSDKAIGVEESRGQVEAKLKDAGVIITPGDEEPHGLDLSDREGDVSQVQDDNLSEPERVWADKKSLLEDVLKELTESPNIVVTVDETNNENPNEPTLMFRASIPGEDNDRFLWTLEPEIDTGTVRLTFGYIGLSYIANLESYQVANAVKELTFLLEKQKAEMDALNEQRDYNRISEKIAELYKQRARELLEHNYPNAKAYFDAPHQL